MPILYIPSYTMYSRLFKNRQNQESFHNGLIATPLIPSAPDGQISIHMKLSELNDKQPMITPTQPIAIDFIDISQSIQTMTSQIDAQTETVQQLSQTNVLPIYVDGDTTVFETPVHASQISFPDETVQSSAWTTSHISELERIAGIQEVEWTVDPLARLSDLLEESDILYRDVSIAYHVDFNTDAYIQSFQDVSGSIHATISSQQLFTADFPAMLSAVTASLTAIAETAEAIHTSGVYDLSLQFDPLPARLAELIGESDQIYQDVYLANHTAFDSSAYLNSFHDASASIYATRLDQQLFTDNLAEMLDTVSISLTDIIEVAESMDATLTDASNQINRMELVLQADESVRDLSFLNTIVSVDADLSITQLESLHVVLDASTSTRFSGVSMVRTVSTDVSATALYMAPYSSGSYSASAPPSFLTNHAVIGQGGTNSMGATKPLTIANPTGTRGVRIPILSSDTTTRTELWSDLTISGGSMNVSGITCSGEVYTLTPSIFLWDNVETLRTVALSSGRCTVDWNQGQSWFVSGVNASFGITINNFPTDTSKMYNLRLLYDSSGGYGSTLRIASTDVSLSIDRGTTGTFANQNITVMTQSGSLPFRALSTLNFYAVPIPPGSIWVARNSVNSTWRSVAYGNERFIAVADQSPRGMISTNGTSWDTLNIPGATWSSITYGNGIFMAISSSNAGQSFSTDDDGSTWIEYTNVGTPLRGVTYGNNLFVAVGGSGGGGSIWSLNNNETTWTNRQQSVTNVVNSVAFGNNLFVAVTGSTPSDSVNNRIYTSSNGTSWTARNSSTGNNWVSIAYGNGAFVAVSVNSIISANGNTNNQVMRSTDGINWTSYDVSDTNSWTSVTYGNGVFVAVSNAGSNLSKRVMTSPDGITWTSYAATANNTWNSITYGNGMFVAVSGSGVQQVMTSGTLTSSLFDA